MQGCTQNFSSVALKIEKLQIFSETIAFLTLEAIWTSCGVNDLKKIMNKVLGQLRKPDLHKKARLAKN